MRQRVSVSDKLTTSVNIPVPKTLKKRLAAVARNFPGKPKPTAMGRILLEQGIEQQERGAEPQVVPAAGQ